MDGRLDEDGFISFGDGFFVSRGIARIHFGNAVHGIWQGEFFAGGAYMSAAESGVDSGIYFYHVGGGLLYDFMG